MPGNFVNWALKEYCNNLESCQIEEIIKLHELSRWGSNMTKSKLQIMVSFHFPQFYLLLILTMSESTRASGGHLRYRREQGQ